MANDEIEEAKAWMANLLKNDSLLTPVFGQRVYADQAYRDLGFPYILITYMSGFDTQGLGTNRLQTTANFQVRIVTEGPPTDNDKTAAKRMDVLLQQPYIKSTATIILPPAAQLL